MNSEVARLAPAIWAEIQQAQHILLHLHVSPDGDSIGSALGLYHALTAAGKKATVIRGDSPIPDYLQKVPGTEEILSQTWGETDLSQFDLFVSLDTPVLRRISGLSEVVFPDHLKVIVIDHHSGPGYGQVNLIVPSYSSVAEMLYDLLKLWGVEIGPECAACLFLGMFTDTGSFRHSSTTGDTMRAAADLRDRSALITPLLFELDNNLSPGELKLDGLAFNKIEVVGKLAMSLVSYSDLQAAGLVGVPIETGHISNKLKAVVGWQVGICALEVEPSYVKLSSRTRDASRYDLSKLMGELGGGGHAAAAGALIKAPIAEARAQILAAAERLYPDLLKN